MRRIKGLFVKEREAPKDGGSGESMAGRVKKLFKKSPRPDIFNDGITPYKDVTDRMGIGVPDLKLYSADPYCTMEAQHVGNGKASLKLLPGVSYPVVWEPAEKWNPPMLDDMERHIKFQIPLGRTWSRLGVTKGTEIEAYALVPIVQVSSGWSRLGIIGRERFSIDVVSGDWDTRVELAEKRYEITNIIRQRQEKALTEIVDFTKGLPEIQRTHALDGILSGLRLGGIDGLLNSNDPEAEINKKIEELVKARDRLKGNNR